MIRLYEACIWVNVTFPGFFWRNQNLSPSFPLPTTTNWLACFSCKSERDTSMVSVCVCVLSIPCFTESLRKTPRRVLESTSCFVSQLLACSFSLHPRRVSQSTCHWVGNVKLLPWEFSQRFAASARYTVMKLCLVATWHIMSPFLPDLFHNGTQCSSTYKHKGPE